MAYIDDVNLIEEIKSLRISVGGKDIFFDEAKESILRIIKEQPTADVAEVKHGRWHTARKTKLSKTVQCTVCDMDFYFKVKGQLNIDMCPYCPNCGAKMNLSELPTD